MTVHGRRTWQIAENVVDCGFVPAGIGEAVDAAVVDSAGGVDVGAAVGLVAGLTGVIVAGTDLRGGGDVGVGGMNDVSGAT